MRNQELAEHHRRRPEIHSPEEDPTQADAEKSQSDAETGAHLCLTSPIECRTLPAQALEASMHDQQEAMQNSPNDEGPVGTVPETAQSHCHHQIATGLSLRAAAASQGNEQIIPQPA